MCSNSVIFGARVRPGSRRWAGGRAYLACGRAGRRSSARHASAMRRHRSGKWLFSDPNMLPSCVFRGVQHSLTTPAAAGGHSVIRGVRLRVNATPAGLFVYRPGIGLPGPASANMAPIRRSGLVFAAQMTRFGPDSAVGGGKIGWPSSQIRRDLAHGDTPELRIQWPRKTHG